MHAREHLYPLWTFTICFVIRICLHFLLLWLSLTEIYLFYVALLLKIFPLTSTSFLFPGSFLNEKDGKSWLDMVSWRALLMMKKVHDCVEISKKKTLLVVKIWIFLIKKLNLKMKQKIFSITFDRIHFTKSANQYFLKSGFIGCVMSIYKIYISCCATRRRILTKTHI